MAYTSGSPGSGGLLEIGIALVLHDRFSNQAREASSQIRKLHMDAKNAVTANLQAINSMASMGMNFAIRAGGMVKNTVMEGAEFIDTMTQVRVISRSTGDEFSSMAAKAKSLGKETMLTAQDIASGMKYLAMAGTEAKDINYTIDAASKLANATGLQLGGKGGTADLMTNVMRMFKKEGAETATVIADQLAVATLSANTNMTDMAEAIKYAGADMTVLKQELPQVAALIGTLGNAGIQGSMAGTAIGNMARYLVKSIGDPKYKGGKMLAKLGFDKSDFVDAKGDLLDFSIVMERLQEALSKSTSTDQNIILQDIFGVRGKRAASMLAVNIGTYRELLYKISEKSAGFTEEVRDKRLNTLPGQIEAMTSSWENLKISFATSLAPVLMPILSLAATIAETIQKIFDTPILGTFISTLLTAKILFIGIGSALAFVGSKWLIFKNDSQVTTSSWFSLMSGGWKKATLDAERYLTLQNIIIAQQKAGITGNAGLIAAAGTGGWVGNVRTTQGKNGKRYWWTKDTNSPTGHRRISESQAAGMVTPGGATSAVMSHGTGRKNGLFGNFLFGGASRLPGGVSATSTGTVATGVGSGASSLSRSAGSLGRIMGGVGRVGGKLLGFLGGPVGIGITALSFIIPSLISATRDNTRAENDTRAGLVDLRDIINLDMNQRIALMTQKTGGQALTEEMRALATIIRHWANIINEDGGKPITLKLTTNGKESTFTSTGGANPVFENNI